MKIQGISYSNLYNNNTNKKTGINNAISPENNINSNSSSAINFKSLSASTKEAIELQALHWYLCPLPEDIPSPEKKVEMLFRRNYKFASQQKKAEIRQYMLDFIDKTDKEFTRITKTINELGPVVMGEGYDLVEGKKDIINNFFDLVEVNKVMPESEVPNGIMIYGNSEEGVNKLTEWLTSKTETYQKEVTYEPEDPMGSLKNIVDAAQMSEILYRATGERTLLIVNNLDELLTNCDTAKGRGYIGRFKTIIENSAKKYHTTFLMKTNKNIDDFEEASIGDQRFEVKVRMDKRAATQKEIDMYEQAKRDHKAFWARVSDTDFENNERYEEEKRRREEAESDMLFIQSL